MSTSNNRYKLHAIGAMGAVASKVEEIANKVQNIVNITNPFDALRRVQEFDREEQALDALLSSSGDSFPGSGYRPANRKAWMEGLGPSNVRVHQVVWPGTHDSATNGIGIEFVSRPFAECQTLSIYQQLAMGCRVLDVRVQQDRSVCHGVIVGYPVDVVLDDVERFLAETSSEVVVLEVRTEFGHDDPPGFEQFLIHSLGGYLIQQDDAVFGKTIAELLPGRVICVWKPRQSAPPSPGSLLWSAGYLRDDWIDTDLAKKKFDSNLGTLGRNPPAAERKYLYRVENTLTPQGNNQSSLTVAPVTGRIHRFARLFISQAFAMGHGDKLQFFSTDFIDEDFVDVCVSVTKSRVDAARGA